MAAILVVAACAGQQSKAQPTQTPLANVQTAGGPSVPPSPTPGPTHVFVIVMENRSAGQAMAGGYTAQLAARYGVATNYHGVTHPSLPNYLALTSGSTWGIADDGYHALPAGGLGAQLTGARITWRAYMEGMGADCFRSANGYALKHNPFPFYGSVCPPQVVPFSLFAGDMSGASIPRFVWITPNLCHDGHDCSTAVADAWLAQTVPTILATSAWKDGGVLFITWDEGEDSANSVLTIAIRPEGGHVASSAAYNHYSLLATIEDRFGLPRLGAARNASAMTDLVPS
jgi:phosphatidylinositol-3-phosphatase